MSPPAAAELDPCLASVFSSVERSLSILQNRKLDSDQRGPHGFCLVKRHLSRTDVALAALQVLRDRGEDLLVREDIALALGTTAFRREVKVAESPLPAALTQEDREAVSRTVASVSPILQVAEAVKSMKEVVAVTPRESDFVRALSDVVLDEDAHVMFRMLAVQSLTQIVREMHGSGLFQDQVLHVGYESLKFASELPGEATWFIGAAPAYQALAQDHSRVLASIVDKSRVPASVQKKP
ncbi:MAG: hypothetical protein HUU37_09475 [Bdellovibrionales bacterium]|nr:hypothetical protein [Bdellovibrionales bacterium]